LEGAGEPKMKRDSCLRISKGSEFRAASGYASATEVLVLFFLSFFLSFFSPCSSLAYMGSMW